VTVISEQVGGILHFRGEISSLSEEESLGFYFTTVKLRGIEDSSGKEATLVIKNETMMLSIDSQTKAIFPDLVLMLEPGTGRGIMSVELEEGMDLALVGLPCHQRLRRAAESESGREAFSPERYGQSALTYQPIEQLISGA
jgi:DUF917 family protein